MRSALTVQSALLDLARRLSRLEAELDLVRAAAFVEPVGESEAFLELSASVRSLALATCPVLFVGERGSGRETAARSLHELRHARTRPFVCVQCDREHRATWGSIPPDPKTRPAPALVALGEGGTLYLRDVDRLPGEAQRSLAASLSAGVPRVVASCTWEGASSLVDELSSALRPYVIAIPSLRRRAGDVRLLAAHFAKLHHPSFALSEDDMVRLETYTWPGNVRELALVIERAHLVGAVLL